MRSSRTWQWKLLGWYRRHRRDLPWRRTKDPYAIWVSEIMLQQTTVQAVIPYYERFLKAFPTVSSLATASEEDVLRLWSGLGYYSRARHLRRAAQKLLAERRGVVPDTVEDLLALPGVGRYTAGAIASIAFGRRAAVVDGNVIRVLSRLFAISKDPRSSEGRQVFWRYAEEGLPSKSTGDFNQALMELGATVCSPEKPSCVRCPLAGFCVASKKGLVNSLPKAAKRKACRDVTMAAAIVLETGRLLMVRRPSHGLLKGLWEFPMVEGDEEILERAWPFRVIIALQPVQHSVLNRRLRITPFVCRLRGNDPWAGKGGEARQMRWVRPEDFALGNLPASSMNRKIWKQLQRVSPPIIQTVWRDSSKRSATASPSAKSSAFSA